MIPKCLKDETLKELSTLGALSNFQVGKVEVPSVLAARLQYFDIVTGECGWGLVSRSEHVLGVECCKQMR